MRLQIFDVEHGACSLLTADNGTRLMIDCGHNVTTGWRPGTYLQGQNINTLTMPAITNYDEDHASGADDLFDNIDVEWLWRNTSVSPMTIKTLKSADGMGLGIARLVKEIEQRFSGYGLEQKPVFAGLTRQCFYNSYPTFNDENNLSMAVFLKCHGIGVMFTGDLEKRGFTSLLQRPDFKQALRETKVYVASHHGRESGCSDEVAALLTNVYYVVISDKGYAHDTQKTLPFYTRIARGGPFRSQGIRYVLTTRDDGRIAFEFSPTSWWPL